MEITGHELRTVRIWSITLQPKCHNHSQVWLAEVQWFPYIWTPHEEPGWQTVCCRCQMKQASTSWLQTLDSDYFCAILQNLRANVGQYLNVSGDYTDVWCVAPATHMLCIHQCQNKIFCIRVFVTLCIAYLFIWELHLYALNHIYYGWIMS
jgi:hypothetical protein